MEKGTQRCAFSSIAALRMNCIEIEDRFTKICEKKLKPALTDFILKDAELKNLKRRNVTFHKYSPAPNETTAKKLKGLEDQLSKVTKENDSLRLSLKTMDNVRRIFTENLIDYQKTIASQKKLLISYENTIVALNKGRKILSCVKAKAKPCKTIKGKGKQTLAVTEPIVPDIDFGNLLVKQEPMDDYSETSHSGGVPRSPEPLPPTPCITNIFSTLGVTKPIEPDIDFGNFLVKQEKIDDYSETSHSGGMPRTPEPLLSTPSMTNIFSTFAVDKPSTSIADVDYLGDFVIKQRPENDRFEKSYDEADIWPESPVKSAPLIEDEIFSMSSPNGNSVQNSQASSIGWM